MPATEADLLSIIEKFYEAALEPSQWESALQALSLAMGGFGASLLPTAQPEKCISSGSLFDANVAYAQEWGAHDPRVKATLALGLNRSVHTDHDLALDIGRHPFFFRNSCAHTNWAISPAFSRLRRRLLSFV